MRLLLFCTPLHSSFLSFVLLTAFPSFLPTTSSPSTSHPLSVPPSLPLPSLPTQCPRLLLAHLFLPLFFLIFFSYSLPVSFSFPSCTLLLFFHSSLYSLLSFLYLKSSGPKILLSDPSKDMFPCWPIAFSPHFLYISIGFL